MKRKLTLSATQTDWELIDKARGNLSLAAYMVRCTLRIIGQEIYLSHHAPDRHIRNKECIYRFLLGGCVSVEDIESHAFSLTQTEIETYLYELEMEGRIERQKARRGRMWRWDVVDK